MLCYCLVYSSTLKTKAVCSCEKYVDFYLTTQRYIPEDRILQRKKFVKIMLNNSVPTPLTEMNSRKGRPALKAGNLTAICEPTVYKTWQPRRLTTLWASMICYRDSFTLLPTKHVPSSLPWIVRNVSFEVLTAATMNVMPCILVDHYHISDELVTSILVPTLILWRWL
jgi:hypothetical protein